MIHDFVAQVSGSVGSRIALIVAFVTFVAIVIHTYSGRRDRFAREAALPFDEPLPAPEVEQTAALEDPQQFRGIGHDVSR